MPVRPAGLTAAAVALAATALAGCAALPADGRQVTQDRPVGDGVTRVVLDGSGTLNLSVGQTPSLRVTAAEDVIDRVQTDVQTDTLRLGLTSGVTIRSGEITYDLVLPRTTALALKGSGRIDADVASSSSLDLELDGSGNAAVRGVDGGNVAVRLSGSGVIEPVGSAATADLLVAGSGNLRAAGLTIEDATANITGSGTIEVNSSRRLLARVSGSGTILHSGTAQVTTEITGSGDVRPR